MRQKFGVQKRTSGPDFMREYLLAADKLSQTIFLLGGDAALSSGLISNIEKIAPRIEVVGCSDVFVNDDGVVEDSLIEKINVSGANSVWVGIGCPKQEAFALRYSKDIASSVFAVGAAFGFLAGTKKRAPKIMQALWLEWLFRLMAEPRRLFWRYIYTNSKFVLTVIFRRRSSRT